MNDSIFEEAMTIQGYSELSLKAMGLFAAKHKRKDEVKAIRAAWLCDPKPYARAVDMMPHWFLHEYQVGMKELLSLIKIAGVRDRFARALLCDDWQRLTLSYDEVRERADAVNKPKAREKQVKRCPYCNEVLP